MDTDTTAVDADLNEDKATDKGPPLPPLRLLAEDHEDLLIISAALQFGDVMAVKSRDMPRAPEIPLELLAMDFMPGEAPGGRVVMMFAGGGDLRVDVECMNAVLADISERWRAKRAPRHVEDPA